MYSFPPLAILLLPKIKIHTVHTVIYINIKGKTNKQNWLYEIGIFARVQSCWEDEEQNEQWWFVYTHWHLWKKKIWTHNSSKGTLDIYKCTYSPFSMYTSQTTYSTFYWSLCLDSCIVIRSIVGQVHYKKQSVREFQRLWTWISIKLSAFTPQKQKRSSSQTIIL